MSTTYEGTPVYRRWEVRQRRVGGLWEVVDLAETLRTGELVTATALWADHRLAEDHAARLNREES